MQQESLVSSTWQTLSSEMARAIEKVGRAIVAVHARRRVPASGVHWRAGIVVTANHAVERDDEITITGPDQSTVPATLVGRDPSTDLAVLRIPAANLPVAEFGEASELAALVAFLASDQAAYVTGVAINFDGGLVDVV